ncbi:hypothetical protein ABGB18_44010 [Nonomuraea sp. B12E4]|uniref:hypothetical protein n=1 Tax=Nonomuraea sp. B12E4 TaxID=3153564 RepID=UPI00325E8CDF
MAGWAERDLARPARPAMLLRPGTRAANTVADRLRVLRAALAQIPDSGQAKILVRVDGAGATHDLPTGSRARRLLRSARRGGKAQAG